MIFAWNYQLRSFVAKCWKLGFAPFSRKVISRDSRCEESYRFSLHCNTFCRIFEGTVLILHALPCAHVTRHNVTCLLSSSHASHVTCVTQIFIPYLTCDMSQVMCVKCVTQMLHISYVTFAMWVLILYCKMPNPRSLALWLELNLQQRIIGALTWW